MTAVLSIGSPPIEIRVRRNKRARRLTLRVSHGGDAVSMTLPPRFPLTEAEAFALSREDWIRARIDEAPSGVRIDPGAVVPVHGVDRILSVGGGRTARLVNDRLEVPGQGQVFRDRLRQFLRLQAREALAVACDHYAGVTDKRYNRLTLRDTRSRWGSCSSSGNLMFSWRLIMAPPAVLDYVAAHEVAHLTHMHHGDEFWDLVEAIKPGYRDARTWLRDHGASLHRFRFDDPMA